MKLRDLIVWGVFPPIFKRLAADVAALINGTTAQALLIYNTYTSDSVYERGFFRFVGNVLQIGAETVGGTVRALSIISGNITLNISGTNRVTFGSGSLTPTTDLAYVLGGPANRFTRLYLGVTTVASLPAAASNTGARASVSDANATTFASIVAGGGSNNVPVYCDGTNWRIG